MYAHPIITYQPYAVRNWYYITVATVLLWHQIIEQTKFDRHCQLSEQHFITTALQQIISMERKLKGEMIQDIIAEL